MRWLAALLVWVLAGPVLAQDGLSALARLDAGASSVRDAGAGLELRNAGTPERFVQNDVEVLIVRGIIANISDRERPVPTMKLVLLDRDKAVVQEKQAPPPVTALDPGGTAGFRIILERPDPNAVEVNVLFVDPNEPPK